MKLDLEAIEERAEKATAGEWAYSLFDSVESWFRLYSENMEEIASGKTWSNPNGPIAERQNADFSFIAHARTDIPALLAFARDAKEALENIADLKNPTEPKYVCWPKSEYMTIAREVLTKWFGEEGEK